MRELPDEQFLSSQKVKLSGSGGRRIKLASSFFMRFSGHPEHIHERITYDNPELACIFRTNAMKRPI